MAMRREEVLADTVVLAPAWAPAPATSWPNPNGGQSRVRKTASRSLLITVACAGTPGQIGQTLEPDVAKRRTVDCRDHPRLLPTDADAGVQPTSALLQDEW